MYCRSFALVVSNLRTVNVIFNYHYKDYNKRRQIASTRRELFLLGVALFITGLINEPLNIPWTSERLLHIVLRNSKHFAVFFCDFRSYMYIYHK